MTPFGDRMRKLRAERGVTLKDMAEALGVSSAYLSALEHGKRGRPGWHLIQRILAYFNIIWDEADEVVRLCVPAGSKARLDCFWDPCDGFPKQLLVRYAFLGRLHQVVVDDEAPLRLPQRKHLVRGAASPRPRGRAGSSSDDDDNDGFRFS